MEEEEESSNKKRKKLCDLELNKLVDNLDDDEPPSLVVTNTGTCGDDVKLMNNSQLEDAIKRNTKTLENTASRLPDGGRKLKEKIASLELEKESRNRRMVKDFNCFVICMYACEIYLLATGCSVKV